jgi:anti-sigma B factor antagonist
MMPCAERVSRNPLPQRRGPMALQITTEAAAPIGLVRLEGQLDFMTAGALAERFRSLHEYGCQQVDVDASALALLDSSGIGALIGAHKLFAAAGGGVRILNPSLIAQEVLLITGLAEYFGAAAA